MAGEDLRFVTEVNPNTPAWPCRQIGDDMRYGLSDLGGTNCFAMLPGQMRLQTTNKSIEVPCGGPFSADVEEGGGRTGATCKLCRGVKT